MFLDMTDTFAVVLFHTYREYMFLESCHKGVHCQLISFPVLHLHGAWCCCHGVVHGKGMTRAPCPRVCSPQTVPCCLQSPAGETLLGAKHLWCSACFSILWVREGGREEIISINLCYPIMGIFDWKTRHKEKAWKLNNEISKFIVIIPADEWGCIKFSALRPLMSALGSWARPLLRALEKSHLWVKQTVLV